MKTAARIAWDVNDSLKAEKEVMDWLDDHGVDGVDWGIRFNIATRGYNVCFRETELAALFALRWS